MANQMINQFIVYKKLILFCRKWMDWTDWVILFYQKRESQIKYFKRKYFSTFFACRYMRMVNSILISVILIHFQFILWGNITLVNRIINQSYRWKSIQRDIVERLGFFSGRWRFDTVRAGIKQFELYLIC